MMKVGINRFRYQEKRDPIVFYLSFFFSFFLTWSFTWGSHGDGDVGSIVSHCSGQYKR